MRIAKIVTLAFVSMMLAATLAVAKKNMPNYDCEKRANDCIADCDKAADTSKNAKNYEKCMSRCNKMGDECRKRQDVATGCAEAFQECIANAKTENQKDQCRATYRKCKGEQR